MSTPGNTTMTRAKIIILVSVVLAGALAGAFAGIYYLFHRVMDMHFVRDALQTAAMEILQEFQDQLGRVSPERIRQVFIINHQSSTSEIWFDAAGNPVDAWGTSFRVTHDQGNPVAWVLCESAGPDREFGTRDDLFYKAER
jgi:hypothetical protein